jgi:hypothetical protein
MSNLYKRSSVLFALTIVSIALAAGNAVPSGGLPGAVHSAADQSDRERLRSLKRAIDEEIGEPRADSVAQCKYIGFGAKPCGGPWMYLVYSTARTDESKLQRLVGEFNALQKKINEEEQVGSDCSVPPELELVLENGVCAAKRK